MSYVNINDYFRAEEENEEEERTLADEDPDVSIHLNRHCKGVFHFEEPVRFSMLE